MKIVILLQYDVGLWPANYSEGKLSQKMKHAIHRTDHLSVESLTVIVACGALSNQLQPTKTTRLFATSQ